MDMKNIRPGILGAICGDIIGLPYELRANRTKDYHFKMRFENFSDDTILTVAIARWIYESELTDDALRRIIIEHYKRFSPLNVWGRGFAAWAKSGGTIDRTGVSSNGAAMRVAAVAYASDDVDYVMQLAEQTARLSHNSDEAVRGAQAVCFAILRARLGYPKHRIRQWIEERFGYDLSRTVAEIRETYHFEITCDRCVPEAITCWLEAESYEQAVRNAVSLGGDSDTLAAMTGAIAAATPGWDIPEEIAKPCLALLPDDFKEMIAVTGL